MKWARIGSAGQSGRTAGPHLHFELRWLCRRLPPGPFLAIDSARRALWRLVRPRFARTAAPTVRYQSPKMLDALKNITSSRSYRPSVTEKRRPWTHDVRPDDR